MKKKVLLVAVLLTMVMVIPSLVMAALVKVDRTTGYFSGNGGEFTLTWTDTANAPMDPPVNGYNSDTKLGDLSIQSFCLETGENVTPGKTYKWDLNTAAVLGGTGSSDTISKGTALLYWWFAAGTLSGYGYNYTPGSDRVASAAALQNAIWWLEGEGGAQNSFATLALNYFGSESVAKEDNATNTYPVWVLNLTKYDEDYITGDKRQDMLVLRAPDGSVPPPVPIPPTVYLLGAGLLGLVGLRRKFKK